MLPMQNMYLNHGDLFGNGTAPGGAQDDAAFFERQFLHHVGTAEFLERRNTGLDAAGYERLRGVRLAASA